MARQPGGLLTVAGLAPLGPYGLIAGVDTSCENWGRRGRSFASPEARGADSVADHPWVIAWWFEL